MAPLAGSVLYEEANKVRVLDMPTALLAALVLLSSLPYSTAEIIDPVEGPVSFGGLMKFEHNAGELTGSTVWVRTIPTWGPLADVYLKDEAPTTQVDYASLPAGTVVDSRGHSSVYDEIWVHAESAGQITFDRFMYPGWRAYLVDREHAQPTQALPVEPRGELGLLSVTVPRGEHFLLLRFEDTPPRIAGTALTMLCLLFTALWAVWALARKRPQSPRLPPAPPRASTARPGRAVCEPPPSCASPPA